MLFSNSVLLHVNSSVNQNGTANHIANVTDQNGGIAVETDYPKEIFGVTITLGCIGLIGCVGNILVILIYGFKSKHTTNGTFFVGLAMADMLVCITTLPSEIIEINNNGIFEIEAVCKLSYFLTYTFVISSVLMLIPLSVGYVSHSNHSGTPKMQLHVFVLYMVLLLCFHFQTY